jgi:hypothetical protein
MALVVVVRELWTISLTKPLGRDCTEQMAAAKESAHSRTPAVLVLLLVCFHTRDRILAMVVASCQGDDVVLLSSVVF